MQVQQFKTNLNCGNCVARVRPFVDELTAVKSWSVDTQNADKILSAELETPEAAAQLIEAIEDAGFDIEPILQN
jgi:copper chaperone CopZ